MRSFFRIFLVLAIIGGVIFTLYYLWGKNQVEPMIYTSEKPYIGSIVKKSVASGSIIPREEIEIKPQVSGIIQEIYVEAGDLVKEGDQIAKVKVIPNMLSLNNAENRLKTAEISVENTKIEYDRNKKLYDQKVIPYAEFQSVDLRYKNAKLELDAATDNLQIVKEGATRKSGSNSLTTVKATVAGMVLDIPIKVGNQVIESNNFNDGTSIASLADMNDLIFEGKIDESEVGKIREGMDIELTVGAIENTKFSATLEYISPKGVDENGAIQFLIRAQVELDSSSFIRAGYSANANIVLDRRDSVLCINESLLQFDEEKKAYVEIETGDQLFEKRYVVLGISDGLQAEVLEGVKEGESVKVWNMGK